MCAGAWTRSELLAVAGRRLDALEAQPVLALERGLDRAQAAGVLRMAAGVVLERGADGGCRAATAPLPYSRPLTSASSRHRAATSPSSAAAPPACTSRWSARRARRARCRWSRESRSPRAPASGPRAGSPRRSRPTTRPSATRRTRSTPVAALCRPAAVEVLAEEAPGGGRRAAAPRRPLRPRARRQPRARPRGRPLARAASSTPAAARPAARSPAGSPRWSPADERDRGAGGSLGAWRSGATAERCAGVITDRGAIARRGDRARDRRRRGAVERTTNPWGAIGAGAVLAHAAGAELADLEFCQFHPTALALPGSRARRRPAHRGDPRRGRDAARRRRQAVHRRARPARPGHRGDPRPDGTPTGRDHVWLDMRGVDPARFPNVFATLPRRRPRPDRGPGPGRARGPLPDGRRRHRPRRPLDARPGSTRSASAPAPDSTAPTGSPRTRSASASCSAPAPPRPPSPSRRPTRRRRPSRGGGASSRRPSRPATRSGAGGAAPRRGRPRAPARRPLSARAR